MPGPSATPASSGPLAVAIEQLTVADEPATWAALGFALDGDLCHIGRVPIRLAGRAAGRGLVEWTLRGASSAALDGLPTRRADADADAPNDTPSPGAAAPSDAAAPNDTPSPGAAAPSDAAASAPAASATHPNGVTALDHVVAIAPALDRTIAALQAAGLDLRRVREEPTPAGAPRQAFFRLGETILEVVQEPPEAIERAGGGTDRPAFFWGLAFVAPDLDATVAQLGEVRVSGPRPAVQPGRRIATLRRSAGLGLPVALMTPR